MNEEYMLAKIDDFLNNATSEYILQKCIEYGCELEPVGLIYEDSFEVSKTMNIKRKSDECFTSTEENQYTFAA